MTLVILVRHGQTEWNRVERFRGRADIPLNQVGIEQARLTGERIAREWMVDVVYSSPLSRSLRTAEEIARHFRLEVSPNAGLEDIDYGLWQGLSPDQVRTRWPQELDDWYSHPESARIPEGESLDVLRARVMNAVQQLCDLHSGRTLAMVGHTVVNRMILLGVLGLGNDRFWRIRQDTCAINTFETDNGDFTMGSLNDTCHLSTIQGGEAPQQKKA
jgi:probable phosphoglycerate mutase